MKHVFFIVVLLIGSSIFGQPVFKVDKATYVFSDAKEGEQLTHHYKITNTGNQPLIISEYKVACSCTKVELPNKPILPKETYALKVTFDTNAKYYQQDRTIVLQANTKKKTEKLRFKVFVYPKTEK
ncbi:MAG: DUF1573 domain-containing protein [Crocinitomicaceae bacterium]|nr:DUF1573 domain-containing protein [Crocinitomicaceae bacterium]